MCLKSENRLNSPTDLERHSRKSSFAYLNESLYNANYSPIQIENF